MELNELQQRKKELEELKVLELFEKLNQVKMGRLKGPPIILRKRD